MFRHAFNGFAGTKQRASDVRIQQMFDSAAIYVLESNGTINDPGIINQDVQSVEAFICMQKAESGSISLS